MSVRSALLCFLLAVMACASSSAYSPFEHGPIHHDPEPAPPVQRVQVVEQMPAHRFEARPHEAREHPPRARVSVAQLPAMARNGKCVPAGAVPEGDPRAALAAAPKRASSPRGAEPQKVAKRSAPAASGAAAPAAEPEAASDYDYDDAPGQSAPPSDWADSGQDRREARRNRREDRRQARQDRRRPLAPTAPATSFEPAATPIEVIEPEPEPVIEWPPSDEGWGGPIYLSNDDTMSLSSAQRVAYAIDNVLPIPPQHVRPHELLNYFSFDTAPVQPGHDFSVHAEVAPSSRDPGLYSLALTVGGRKVGRTGRRNAVLTLVVDVSGSMRKEGRMDYLKRGLLRMVRELEPGDVVHMVTFDHRVCVPLQNYVVGRDDPQVLTRTIHALRPAGYTNLHAGLLRGYELADRAYQPSYTNRVLLITDALANRGVTDAKTLSVVSDWYDSRRIRLSGIGVGTEFNDALLDRLTETGRGAYVFLGSPAEVDAVFGHRFVSLIETTANDVHFRLHLPPSLRMRVFHGEQAGAAKKDVQAVHFFADTSVMLLSELEAWQGELRPQDDIMLEIDYLHPETGAPMVEEYAINLGDAQRSAQNVRKAELITHFIHGVARMAARGAPTRWRPELGTWRDADALGDCTRTRAELREIAREATADAEVRRVFGLWDDLCARFEGPGGTRPLRKDDLERDVWPDASRG
jgi:hypothetical protein